MISIIIPIHDMENAEYFLSRCMNSIRRQSYQDYEIIIKKTGKGMARNTNAGIKEAKGDLIKILFMDDYFAHNDSLKNIVKNFKGEWLVTGCEHDNGTRYNKHIPKYSKDIYKGNNTIGSPSVLTMKNKIYFNENMSWLVDCELYKRLYDAYGEPTILEDINVVIGIHEGQMTNKISDNQKTKEAILMAKKYD